ncbi:MAG: hypothetical protein GQ570_03245 [Helicobacteraceae bacterium]|nr:hypothetical protein [Helicobacteraceae bacterium]
MQNSNSTENENVLIHPEKLQAIRKQLEARLDRRKRSKDLLLPQEKNNFLDKMKNALHI